MRILAIHTAQRGCDVALVADGRPVTVRTDAEPTGQDQRLPGLVRTVLAEAGLTLGSLDRLAVVTGPGSFTGVRIGVAFARGLALVSGRLVIGITTLQAALPHGFAGPALVALQAKRRPPDQTVWVQTFTAGRSDGPPTEERVDDLAARAAGRMVFSDWPDGLTALADFRLAAPSAVEAACHAAGMDPSAAPADPVYVRPPDAALPMGPR